MISLVNVKRFCKEYWKIENYQEAANDTERIWVCHHRFEIDHNMSVLELQALGFYFNRPFYELIFLTPKEHTMIHKKGQHHTEETKQKIRDSLKGENNPMFGKESPMRGKHLSEETKRKISDSLKGENNPMYGKTKSEETKKRIGKGNTKYHITEEELYDLYVVQGLSQNQIAVMYGCDPTTILYKLKKFNIKKHK